jgi:hypothetical protein
MNRPTGPAIHFIFPRRGTVLIQIPNQGADLTIERAPQPSYVQQILQDQSTFLPIAIHSGGI